MSHAEEEVVELLAALSAGDRRWIVERLSPAAQERLTERIAAPYEMSQANSPQRPTEQGVTFADARELERCMARIVAADASSMLRVLRDEPGWLVKAVLQLSDWPWRKQFVQGLPTAMRIDVAQRSANEAALGGSARSQLLCELSASLVALPSETRPDSRFAALLARATKRVVRQ